jgi:Ohr subfamily peroxiredoxin
MADLIDREAQLLLQPGHPVIGAILLRHLTLIICAQANRKSPGQSTVGATGNLIVDNLIAHNLNGKHWFIPQRRSPPMKVLYTAHGSATGGREGQAATDTGNVKLVLNTPKELGGGGGDGTNPEQLFSMGYSACFLGALKFVAGKEKVKIPEDARVSADVGIGARDDGQGFGIAVKLTISVPGVDKTVVEDLVKKAHVVCPYSHATRGNIDVDLQVAA